MSDRKSAFDSCIFDSSVRIFFGRGGFHILEYGFVQVSYDELKKQRRVFFKKLDKAAESVSKSRPAMLKVRKVAINVLSTW